MARPSKLDPTTTSAILDALRTGIPKSHAARAAGVSPRSLYSWLARGKRDQDGPYIQFMRDCKKAESAAVGRNVSIINRAAAGGVVTKRVTKPDGSVVETLSEPLWCAAAWFLERSHPEYFSLNRNELKELAKTLVETNKRIKELEEQLGVRRAEAPVSPV